MSGKGNDLAARFRAAMEREDSHSSDEQQRLLNEQAAGRLAREELFQALVDFGAQLPFLRTVRADGGVELSNGDAVLRFLPEGDGERVVLDYTGLTKKEAHHLYREASLDSRWIWTRRRGAREDRLPLFDQGLEVLLVHALGLPDPDAPSTAGSNPASDTPMDKGSGGGGRAL